MYLHVYIRVAEHCGHWRPNVKICLQIRSTAKEGRRTKKRRSKIYFHFRSQFNGTPQLIGYLVIRDLCKLHCTSLHYITLPSLNSTSTSSHHAQVLHHL
jgi:hypothetical protein